MTDKQNFEKDINIPNKEIILTGEEIERLYQFYKKTKPITAFAKVHHNIVIKGMPCGGIGELVYVQTQDDFCKKADNWVEITDYESW